MQQEADTAPPPGSGSGSGSESPSLRRSGRQIPLWRHSLESQASSTGTSRGLLAAGRRKETTAGTGASNPWSRFGFRRRRKGGSPSSVSDDKFVGVTTSQSARARRVEAGLISRDLTQGVGKKMKMGNLWSEEDFKRNFKVRLIVLLILAGISLGLILWRAESNMRASLESFMVEYQDEFYSKFESSVFSILRIKDAIYLPDNFLVEGADQSGELDEWRARMSDTFATWARLSRHDIEINQIRIIDGNGMERVRVNHDFGDPAAVYVVPLDELQDKSERAYVSRIGELSPGRVYVSSIDPNQENGVYEEPRNLVYRIGMGLFTSTQEQMANSEAVAAVFVNFFFKSLIDPLANSAKEVKGLESWDIIRGGDGLWLASSSDRVLGFEELYQDKGESGLNCWTELQALTPLGEDTHPSDDVAQGTYRYHQSLFPSPTFLSRSSVAMALRTCPVPSFVQVQGDELLCGAEVSDSALDVYVVSHFSPSSSILYAAWGVIGLLIVFFVLLVGNFALLYRERSRGLNYKLERLVVFISSTLHEVRTPLHVLVGSIALLKGSCTFQDWRRDEDLSSTFGMVDEASGTLMHLVDDVLFLSKVREGQLALSLSEIDLEENIMRLLQRLAIAANNRKVDLIADSSLRESLGNSTSLVDWEKLEHIITNLVSNAIKFTPGEGSILCSCQARVVKRDCGGNGKQRDPITCTKMVYIYVADTGVGISEEKKTSIFEPYKRAHGREYSGTGLGLTIAKKLAECMGGRLELTFSKDNEGTTMLLTFPVQKWTEESSLASRISFSRAWVAIRKSRSNDRAEIFQETAAAPPPSSDVDTSAIRSAPHPLPALENELSPASASPRAISSFDYRRCIAFLPRPQLAENVRVICQSMGVEFCDIASNLRAEYLSTVRPKSHPTPPSSPAGSVLNERLCPTPELSPYQLPRGEEFSVLFRKLIIETLAGKGDGTGISVGGRDFLILDVMGLPTSCSGPDAIRGAQDFLLKILSQVFCEKDGSAAPNIPQRTVLISNISGKRTIDKAALRSHPELARRMSSSALRIAHPPWAPSLLRDVLLPSSGLDSPNSPEFAAAGFNVGGDDDVAAAQTLPQLPLSESSVPNSRCKPPRPPVALGAHGTALNIMVVDDLALNRKILCRMLETFGHRPTPVSGGRECLERLGSGEFYHMIFMDLHMPEMDGCETTAVIVKNWSRGQRPLIMGLTASPLAEESNACLASGMDGVMIKPITIQDLHKILGDAIESGILPSRTRTYDPAAEGQI